MSSKSLAKYLVAFAILIQGCTHLKNTEKVQDIRNSASLRNAESNPVQALQQMSFVAVQKSDKIKKDFEIGKYEVTQLEWFLVMGENPSEFKTAAHCTGDYKVIGQVEMCERHPVDSVSFDDIQLFLNKINSVSNGYVYDLPTYDQWDYAARAGRTTKYTYGNDKSDFQEYAVSNVKEQAGVSSEVFNQTAQIGTKKPNAFGIYDMHGNVWEWTTFKFGGFQRFLRGGSWIGKSFKKDHWFNFDLPFRKEIRDRQFGFRLARSYVQL